MRHDASAAIIRALLQIGDIDERVPQIDLAASLSHVEQRVIGNDYTFSFDCVQQVKPLAFRSA
jgi:hypothetical protein